MVGLEVDNKLERLWVKVILPIFKVPVLWAGIAQLGKNVYIKGKYLH
jgi:hypothetical protein